MTRTARRDPPAVEEEDDFGDEEARACPYCPGLHHPADRCDEPYTLRELEDMALRREPWER